MVYFICLFVSEAGSTNTTGATSGNGSVIGRTVTPGSGSVTSQVPGETISESSARFDRSTTGTTATIDFTTLREWHSFLEASRLNSDTMYHCIIRQHRSTIDTDEARRSIVVCLYVCWSRSCALQIRLKRWKFCLGADSGWPKEPRIMSVLGGGTEPTRGRGNVWGCPAHWKIL